MTQDELKELREKSNKLTAGMEDRIVFNAVTGRATWLVEPNKFEKACDLEKAIPYLRLPTATDDEIKDLTALVQDVNALMRKYIDEYGQFPPELSVH